MDSIRPIADELRERFPAIDIAEQQTKDDTPTLWIDRRQVKEVLTYLKCEAVKPYRMLFDLAAVDERARRVPGNQLDADFSVVYDLLSFDRNADVRIKVPLKGDYPSIDTVTDIWQNANWYEREVWDMFGIEIDGHPFQRRILNPPDWVGHPLRKEFPARATDLPGYTLTEDMAQNEEEILKFHPEEYGLKNPGEDCDCMFLNFGPHHPGTHGLLRVILQLQGERIVDSVIDIGWHHRGAEKMAERQTFHTYIPYTDRVDYLAGVQNEFPYVMTVEKLAGIEVPPRAQVIRVMMSELFRIANHLVYLGTFGSDVGALSPVFFTFNDRERLFDIIEAIGGGRMHPQYFRIGGVVQDLPNGWTRLVEDLKGYLEPRLTEYDRVLVKNSIFKKRTKGIGVYTPDSAIEWGVTGPNLRSTGVEWDLRKKRPYSSYDQFEFEVPTASDGDSYSRCLVRVEEMRQSLRIIEQAAKNMPEGDCKSRHPLAMPPRKERTMADIETLINHFLSVSWGQPIPPGEAMVVTEAPKGMNGYYVTSDGSNWPYRCRIRTGSFPHIQSIPMLTRGLLISDLISILGSIDFVLADVDR